MAGEEWAVVTRDLRKTYRGRVAVDSLDLRVPARGVHGFLGPNGSGKTTTIRMLLGLVAADAGRMRIFGTSVPRALPEVINRVGAIVESPKFFPTFTARRNLELLARAVGAPGTAVDDVLERTGLRDRAGERYRGYSLGMKQRLAIAATLLKSPDLLIFDEPTNGLDPAGIHEIRRTMRRLADEGHAVLVSSHILAEVEQVADTVSIIGQGRLLASGSVAEVVGDRVGSVQVAIADPDGAAQVLEAAGLLVRRDGDGLVVDGESDPARITYLLAQQGRYVHGLHRNRAGLESVFLELTSGHGLGEGESS
jgi:ABC-type multidrug transport system ATPase subunit